MSEDFLMDARRNTLRNNFLFGEIKTKRVNEVGFKGQLRKCITCGDVKIWDYPNERKCPTGKNHKWRPIEENDLTKEENDSIDKQIEIDSKRIVRNPQIIINSKEDAEKLFAYAVKDEEVKE